MAGWSLGNLDVIVEMGHVDDSDIDVVVKTKDISPRKGGANIIVQEGSDAEEVLYWPVISIASPDRRAAIYTAALNALETAKGLKAEKVGFFTMGLEVSRIPSWEVAEEIVKAIINHSRSENNPSRIFLVASSPIQVSSFQFALNNMSMMPRK